MIGPKPQHIHGSAGAPTPGLFPFLLNCPLVQTCLILEKGHDELAEQEANTD